jgi:hypothetical protein
MSISDLLRRRSLTAALAIENGCAGVDGDVVRRGVRRNNTEHVIVVTLRASMGEGKDTFGRWILTRI